MSTSPTLALAADDHGTVDDRFLDLACRIDYATRDLGRRDRCGDCGLGLALVLIPRRTGPVCYRCDRVRHGRRPSEDHHLGGRPSPLPTVAVEANLHRLLSVAQELFWRRRFEPGSPKAVRIDLTALVVLGLAYAKEMNR
jgi:hypothetical protein